MQNDKSKKRDCLSALIQHLREQNGEKKAKIHGLHVKSRHLKAKKKNQLFQTTKTMHLKQRFKTQKEEPLPPSETVHDGKAKISNRYNRSITMIQRQNDKHTKKINPFLETV